MEFKSGEFGGKTINVSFINPRDLKNIISSLHVCMVNTIYLFSFVETPRKFIIAKLSISKLGSSSVLMILLLALIILINNNIINNISIIITNIIILCDDIILYYYYYNISIINNTVISTDEDPSLRIESFAIISIGNYTVREMLNSF